MLPLGELLSFHNRVTLPIQSVGQDDILRADWGCLLGPALGGSLQASGGALPRRRRFPTCPTPASPVTVFCEPH